MRRACLKQFVMLFAAALLAAPLSSHAQGQREIDTIAQIGKELVAQRKVIAAAKAEAEHQARLEEQSKLKKAYQQYLGAARRTALALVAKKRKAADGQQVEQMRRQARVIIDEVTDPTKARVIQELDPLFDKLVKTISITPEEMLAADPNLKRLRQQLAGGSGNKLDWVDEAAILYALCHDNAEQMVIANNVKYREKLSVDEAAAIDECNRRRLVLGLNPLRIDMALVLCGRDHSSDMIKHKFFAHNSPVEGKATPWIRAENFGTKAAGENIAAGYGNGIAVTIGWWRSPGHLKNLMGKGFNSIGVGQDNKHYTQMFGR